MKEHHVNYTTANTKIIGLHELDKATQMTKRNEIDDQPIKKAIMQWSQHQSQNRMGPIQHIFSWMLV